MIRQASTLTHSNYVISQGDAAECESFSAVQINERFLKLTETILVNERQHCFDKSSTIMRISGHNDKDDYGNANTDRR
jgi:hypothetical protein